MRQNRQTAEELTGFVSITESPSFSEWDLAGNFQKSRSIDGHAHGNTPSWLPQSGGQLIINAY